jgi:hypothetical protein
VISRWVKNVRAAWRRISPPPIETSVRCDVEDLERFIQRLIALAQPTAEQVTWGNLKIVTGAIDLPVKQEISVGVSLRRGVFILVDATHNGGIEFEDENPVATIQLRHAAAERLYTILVDNYGIEPNEEMAASIEVQ